MIFPLLRGIVLPQLAPITYFLFAINLFVFAGTYEAYEAADKRIDELLGDEAFLETQGAAFALMIERQPKAFSSALGELGRKTLDGDPEARRFLGNIALRNVTFMAAAEKFDFDGDEVALKSWRQKLVEMKKIQDEHPSFQWGLSHSRQSWLQWLTYQFSHSGGKHLFFNMLFLLIFGIFVETRLGASFVIITYLGGGLLGAYVYSLLSGFTPVPLVGASGAVSGLIGLVAFGWIGKERLRFLYWLLPFKDYYGVALLPSWLVMIVSILPDVSGYIAASRDLSAIAYSAHLGGVAFGILMAGLLAIRFLVPEVEGEDEEAGPADDIRRAG